MNDNPPYVFNPGETASIRSAIIKQTEGFPWSDWTKRIIDLLGDIILNSNPNTKAARSLAIGESPDAVINQFFNLIKYDRPAVDATKKKLGLI